MPRTFSGPERTKSKATVVRHVLRAEVMDVDASWQDLRDLGPDGVDILVGGTISTTVDELVWRATVRVALGRETEGASPLLEGSLFNRASGLYSPLLTPGAQIRLYADTLGVGESADETTKRLMFWGRIDRCEFASDPVTLTCRDLGGKLLDTIVREDRTYGDKDTPVAAHLVMQQFLDDNADIIGESITLEVPDPPTYLVEEFRQVGVSVLDALNTLAMLFGWVVRYTFDASDAFVLTLYDPLRDRVIPAGGDYLIEPTEYHEVPDAALDLTGVRNRLRGWYRDGVTGEALAVEVSDSGSILAFGERFEQFGGDLLLPITTGNQMLAFLQYALADQSSPPFDHTVKMFFLHFVALGDVPELAPNDVHYDEAQQLAVVGITHEFPDSGQGAATTSLATRGTPSGAYKRWLRFRGGPVIPLVPPAPELMFALGEMSQFGGTVDTVDGGIWLGYRMPAGVDEIRVHVLLGMTQDIGIPSIDAGTYALTIRRPEGDLGTPEVGIENQFPNSPGEYASLALLSTRPNLYKRLLFYGVRGGLTSVPVITPARPAIDPSPTRIDGTIASMTVVRSGSTNTITVTPGTLESTDDTRNGNWLCLMRNEHVLPPVYIKTDTTPIVFVDSGLPEDASYEAVYDAFIWNGGQSGPLFRGVAGAPTITPPEWALGTPTPVIQAGAARIQLSWTATTPGATGVRVEATIDGQTTRTVGTGALASGTVYDSDTSAKRYRLVAFGGSGDLAWTPWKWSTRLPPTISNPAAVPQIVTGYPRPKLFPGSPIFSVDLRLALAWTCATPGAAQIRIQESDDNGVGDPWATVTNGVTASVASGTWYSPSAVAIGQDKWYRVQALALDGTTVLATSTAVHYIPAS